MSGAENMEMKKLLYEIGKYDFILVELTQYLDTHPYDQEAIEKFKLYNRKKQQLSMEYIQKYGPLMAEDAGYGKSCNDSNEWKWATQAQPWERGY